MTTKPQEQGKSSTSKQDGARQDRNNPKAGHGLAERGVTEPQSDAPAPTPKKP